MMAAELTKLDPVSAKHAFSRARDVIRSGGVIAYPTETFYALGVDPRNVSAVCRLFTIKGRREDRPILLLIADAGAATEWVAAMSETARRFMERHWPGPLTMIFRAKPSVPTELTSGTGTIGLRVPGNETTRALLCAVGTALTGTSANRSGMDGLTTAQAVEEELGGEIDLILDGGPTPGGLPSTVVDVTGEKPFIIRRGAVTLADDRNLKK